MGKRTQVKEHPKRHITDARILGYVEGVVELTDVEQDHIRDCPHCNDRFRMFLTSSGEAKAS